MQLDAANTSLETTEMMRMIVAIHSSCETIELKLAAVAVNEALT